MRLRLFNKKLLADRDFGALITLLGGVGLVACLILSYEKLAVALNPEYIPSCNISPIASCTSVLASGTDSLLLGVPNSFFGMAAFGALIAVGVAMIAGAKFDRWFWQLFFAATMAGVAMVAFFLYQSLYVIGSLCVYCMTTWAVVLALALYGSIFLVQKKIVKLPKWKQKYWPAVVDNHLGVLILIYLTVFALILFRFREYFEATWF